MAYPTIQFNNGTGSDTAASGSGGTAVTAGGNDGASLASSTTVTLSADSPDLSGVATDGSMAIWVDASSGRKWSKITGVDNGAKTVTVETAYSVTESGKNWGIGGKRATMANAIRLGLDLLAGWTIDIDSGDTHTLTTAFVVSPANVAGLRCTITCSTATTSSSTRPTITTSTNSIHIFNVSSANNLTISNLNLTNTAGTKGQGITPVSALCAGLTVRNCVLDGFNNGIEMSNATFYSVDGMIVDQCEIKNCTRDGISHGGSTNGSGTVVSGCNIHDNTGDGIKMYGTTFPLTVIRCRIMNNTKSGIYYTGSGVLAVISSSLSQNTRSGIENNGGGTFEQFFLNNIFWSNTRYGIEGSATVNQCEGGYNAFGDNTLGARSIFTALTGDISITVDPSTNEPSDSNLNSTAGGGAACKGAGGPTTFVGQADTLSAPDIGAAQHGAQAAPGGSGNFALSEDSLIFQ